jgi:preprotein translocase subunit SecA
MFQQMMGAIREESVGFLFNLEVQVQAAEVKPDTKQLTYTSPSEDGVAEVHEGSSNAPGKPVDQSNDGDDNNGAGSAFFRR